MAESTVVPVRKPTSWPKAAVIITLLLVIGAPLAYVMISWNRAALDAPGRMMSALGEAVRPRININQIVLTSIGDLHRVSKLVVLKTNVAADVTRDESSSSWGMYWGTNTARDIVKDAHVQFLIDLEAIGTSNYVYDESKKTLILVVPAPRLDPDVSIDPATIQTVDLRGGWARWDKTDTRDDAIKELVPTVIIQANSPLLKKEAKEAGIEAMTNWCKPLADTLAQDGVTLTVKYEEDATTQK